MRNKHAIRLRATTADRRPTISAMVGAMAAAAACAALGVAAGEVL